MHNDVTRRTFLAALSASAAGVLTGGLQRILAAIPEARDSTFQLGGDLLVNRLGFGAMSLTGEGIWGWPPDRENAKKVLRLILRKSWRAGSRPLQRDLMHRKPLMMR